MPQTATAQALIVPKVEKERDAEFQCVYVNNVQVALGPYDLRLDFGDAEQTKPDTVRVKQKVQVVMSLDHAIAMVEVLDRLLKNVPRRPGAVPLREARAD